MSSVTMARSSRVTLWQQSLNDLGVQTIFCSIRSPRSTQRKSHERLSRLFRGLCSHSIPLGPIYYKDYKWLNHTSPMNLPDLHTFRAQFNKKPKTLFPILAKWPLKFQFPLRIVSNYSLKFKESW